MEDFSKVKLVVSDLHFGTGLRNSNGTHNELEEFYFDDKLIRTIPNNLCDEELNIYLSLAILEHAGEVTDAVDGTSMKIDYVRYYEEK